VAAVLEGRLFPAYSTGLLGPRAELSFSVARDLPVRLRADGGAAFGTAHDAIGDVDLAFVSGAVGIALGTDSGTLGVEIGPKVEVGRATARGIPFDTTVRGSRADAALVTASLLAAISMRIAPDWRAALAVDVGATPAGLDARADGRRAGGLGGPMLGVRIGVGYARP
jgi:hypothetical protein